MSGRKPPKRTASGRKPAKRTAPPIEYSLLLTATLCLLALGAVMVFSASSATSLLAEGGGDGPARLFSGYWPSSLPQPSPRLAAYPLP